MRFVSGSGLHDFRPVNPILLRVHIVLPFLFFSSMCLQALTISSKYLFVLSFRKISFHLFINFFKFVISTFETKETRTVYFKDLPCISCRKDLRYSFFIHGAQHINTFLYDAGWCIFACLMAVPEGITPFCPARWLASWYSARVLVLLGQLSRPLFPLFSSLAAIFVRARWHDVSIRGYFKRKFVLNEMNKIFRFYIKYFRQNCDRLREKKKRVRRFLISAWNAHRIWETKKEN